MQAMLSGSGNEMLADERVCNAYLGLRILPLIPAQAGIQTLPRRWLGPRLRGDERTMCRPKSKRAAQPIHNDAERRHPRGQRRARKRLPQAIEHVGR
jgi:hypothetical protein